MARTQNKNFCLIKDDVDKLMSYLKTGENYTKFFELTSQERKDILKTFMSEEEAKTTNTTFEKALAKKKNDALTKALIGLYPKAEQYSIEKQALDNLLKNNSINKDTYDARLNKLNSRYDAKDRTFEGLQKKLVKMSNDGILANIDNTIDDFVEAELGAVITPEEAKKIDELVIKMKQELDKGSDNPFDQYNKEFYIARSELEKYLNAITPQSSLRLVTTTIFMGNMLSSLKSATTNVIGNSSISFGELLRRRVQTGKIGIDVKFTMGYMKHAISTYKNSGIDIVRVDRLENNRKLLGEKISNTDSLTIKEIKNDNTLSQKDKFKKISQALLKKSVRPLEKIVFKFELGLPDMVFASFHFADSVSRWATFYANMEADIMKISKEDRKSWVKARSKELKYEATQIDPQNEVAQALRNQAKEEALFATYQNNNKFTELSNNVRDNIDKYTGDLMLGTIITPFVKTPTNVVRANLMYGGAYLPKAFYNFVSSIKNGEPREMRLNDEAEILRSMIGLSSAPILYGIIKSLFDVDDDEIDIIPDYMTASATQKAIVRNGNATYNSIVIGNKAISTDYFGSMALPLIAYIKSQKNEDEEYGKNLLLANWANFAKTPVLRTILDYSSEVDKFTADGDTLASAVMNTFKSLPAGIYSRTTPAIISDFAKMSDDYQRYVDRKDWVSPILEKIPVLREELPIKINDFGQDLETEDPLVQLFFGARVRTTSDSFVYKEVKRLMDKGQNVTMQAGGDQKGITQLIDDYGAGDKYSPELLPYYKDIGQRVYKNSEWIIKTKEYKEASNEDKKGILNDARTSAINSYIVKLIKDGTISNTYVKSPAKGKYNYPYNSNKIKFKNL